VKQVHNGYEIDEDRSRLNFERIHQWLTNTYWSPGVSRELCEKAAQGSSLVLGAYKDCEQVGYLRVVSDKATFAWICDVYVDEAHRGKGLARAMVRFAQQHPEHQGLRRWVLATRDAHGVYQAVGFDPLATPDRWMIYAPQPDICLSL
jgi:GNAT superfamily N-acetyltransferase